MARLASGSATGHSMHHLCPKFVLASLTLGSLACGATAQDPGPAGHVLVAGDPSEVVAVPPTAGETTAATSEFDQEHTVWTQVLGKYVSGDDFDYGGLAKDREDLDGYLAALHAVTPAELASWPDDERFAFWINAYNAHTIEKIVDNYPLKSIRKLDGLLGIKSVFDDEFIPMKAHHPEGEDDELSLNDIEHGILRKQFKDARLHAAVNCASVGCPPLRNEAFVAPRLEAQLDQQMRSFVNDADRNQYGPKDVRVSEIFKWFAEDFERDAGSVRAYLLKYASKENAAFLQKTKLRYVDYDWDLNDTDEDRP